MMPPVTPPALQAVPQITGPALARLGRPAPKAMTCAPRPFGHRAPRRFPGVL